MPNSLRIASFNLENFDNKPDQIPSLESRIELMRPQLIRLNADILCLQEVNGQETEGEPRKLLALQKLIEGTKYEHYNIISTKTADGYQIYDERNLVILSKYKIESSDQFRNDLIDPPMYRKVMAIPDEVEAKKIDWERPILFAKVKLPDDRFIYVLNLHLKSKIPSSIPGQKISSFSWKSVGGWAEGYFISSMKRVGQALETRVLIDKVFDEDNQAYIVVCGDFNANSDQVPVKAIVGQVEHTGNGDLASRTLFPCDRNIADSQRFSLLHHGKGEMIDHLLVSRNLMQNYQFTEIHNEMLHDESISFATDKKYPESDHAPIVAEFVLD